MIAVAETCDAGSLTFSNGLAILLNRKLDTLRHGEILEVRLNDRSAAHDVRAWARLAGNRWIEAHETETGVVCLLERGSAQRLIVESAADWGNQAPVAEGHLDTRALLLGA